MAVPNFTKYAELYNADKITIEQCLGPLFGRWQMCEQNKIYHKTSYDYKSLKNVLEEVGFNNVRLWDWSKTEHSHFDDYSQSYIPHMDKTNGVLMSLNVECTN